MKKKVLACATRGRSDGEWHASEHHQRIELGDEIANAVTSVAKDCLICEIYEGDAVYD